MSPYSPYYSPYILPILTIGGFFDSDVDVRHIPLQDSLKNIVRQRWEITCKRREGNYGSEIRPALGTACLSPRNSCPPIPSPISPISPGLGP